MKFHYYPETDSLYIELTERDSVDSQEASPGVVLDYDSDGILVGIDIDHASSITDVTGLADTKSVQIQESTSGKITVTKDTKVPSLNSGLLKSIFSIFRRSTPR